MRLGGAILVALLAAALLAGAAPAAKPDRAPSVRGSFDFVWVPTCTFEGDVPRHGHIEVSASDDDLVFGPGSSDPQADRMSLTVTFDDGQVWSQNPIAVTITGHEATFAIDSWYTTWTFHDGGSPGTTADWAGFQGFGVCSPGTAYLTGGNIKITT